MIRLRRLLRPGIVRSLFDDRRLRYLVVGGVTSAVELGVFQGAILIGAHAVVANVISFSVALVVSFTGYTLWSFAGDHMLRVHARLGAYTTLAVINMIVSSALIHGLTTWGLVPWIAKAVCMVLVALSNYGLLSRLIFRHTGAGRLRSSLGATGGTTE